MEAKKIVKDWLTEGDGESWDPLAFLCLITTIFILVVVGHSYFVHNEKFDLSDFGLGIAAVWGAYAGGARIRPHAKNTPP